MGEIRLTGGRERGRVLKTLRGSATRPTSGRVKEALFNILGTRIMDARFLEPFGGSGAVSFEAVSRGAKSALILEKARDAAKVIAENVEALKYEQVSLMVGDALKGLESPRLLEESFDFVFLDPPYGGTLALDAFRLLVERGLVQKQGLIILEHRANEGVPEAVGEWHKAKSYRYGESSLSLYACVSG